MPFRCLTIAHRSHPMAAVPLQLTVRRSGDSGPPRIHNLGDPQAPIFSSFHVYFEYLFVLGNNLGEDPAMVGIAGMLKANHALKILNIDGPLM